MAVKKTTQIGNRILRTKAETVKEINSAKLKKLIVDLVDTMRENNLVGIAAPQIGVSLRVFVTEIRKTKLRKNAEVDGLRVFINPQIISVSKKISKDWEGCGSVAQGGLFAMVSRPESVKVQAYNERGEWFVLETSGLLARIIQHENDHLNGIMFTDIAEIKTLIGQEEYLKIKMKKAKTKNHSGAS